MSDAWDSRRAILRQLRKFCKRYNIALASSGCDDLLILDLENPDGNPLEDFEKIEDKRRRVKHGNG